MFFLCVGSLKVACILHVKTHEFYVYPHIFGSDSHLDSWLIYIQLPRWIHVFFWMDFQMHPTLSYLFWSEKEEQFKHWVFSNVRQNTKMTKKVTLTLKTAFLLFDFSCHRIYPCFNPKNTLFSLVRRGLPASNPKISNFIWTFFFIHQKPSKKNKQANTFNGSTLTALFAY